MPRSTIHFYIREGLLPQPSKTAVSRSLYSEHHVELIKRIGELKRSGCSLAEIKEGLADSLNEANQNGVDLAAQETERAHKAIISAATQEFITKGYKQTHVSTIIKKAGVTPHVFYTHFTSKRRLLLECFGAFIKWNVAERAPDLAHISDFGERLLHNLVGDLRVRALGVDVLALILSEGTHKESDLRRPMMEAFETIVGPMITDLAAMRPPGSGAPAVPDELLVFSLLGAQDSCHMRASWDDKYGRADLLRTHLWLYLAIEAVMSGEVDISGRLARYEDLIQEIAARKVEAPTGFKG
ncbi:MAG: TetR family transcriptional regulator [Thermoleophilia bacterium]|nr:TetR family transcriptional regulator [Thermoleophilia bacterium]